MVLTVVAVIVMVEVNIIGIVMIIMNNVSNSEISNKDRDILMIF